MTTSNLKTTFAGVELENPFMLSSAPPARSAEMIKRAFDAGWSGAVTKTISIGGVTNVRPRFGFWKERGRILGMTNIELIAEETLDHWVGEIAEVKRVFPDRALVASIMGGLEPLEWELLVRGVQDAGADAIELNVSCPHGMPEQHMGAFMGQDPELIKLATAAAVEPARVPVWVKLTPNVTDIAQMALAAQEAGAAALTAINTVSGLIGIDLDTFEPIPSVGGFGTFGGYSGKGIKPIALRAVATVADATGLPVSAVGGIGRWEDAAEFLLAGAGSFQVCTEVMLRGYGIIEELVSGLESYLEQKGFATLDEARGEALAHVADFSALDAGLRSHAEVISEACNLCGRCLSACRDGGYQAVSLTDETASIDPARCDGCALCASVCNQGAIRLVRD